MAKKVKFSSELPEEIYERYFALEHGQKQLACGAGLLLYFACDEDTQWAYREWARAIVEGHGTMESPPRRLRSVLEAKSPTPAKHRKK